jgi:hypothetical protein
MSVASLGCLNVLVTSPMDFPSHRRLNVPSALIGKTNPDDRPGTHWVALYIDVNSRGEYYDPTGRPPFSRAYMNFMNKHCTRGTVSTFTSTRLTVYLQLVFPNAFT